MGNIKNVLVVLDLAVQFLNACEFAEGYLSVGLLMLECLTKVVIPAVKIINREQIRDSDGLVEALAA